MSVSYVYINSHHPTFCGLGKSPGMDSAVSDKATAGIPTPQIKKKFR